MPTETESLVLQAMHRAIETSDGYECRECGSHHPLAYRVTVTDGMGNRHTVGDTCAGLNDYVPIPSVLRARNETEWQHIDNTVVSVDTDERATSRYASFNWQYSDDGEWYRHSHNMPENEDNATFDYSTDILDVHGWPDVTPAKALCFGVELEIEARNRVRELADKLGNMRGDGETYILKHDGSLSNGVEMVTLPYTLDFHQKEFNWAGKLQGVELVGTSGARGTTTCGIHVHVNRAALSSLTLGKMLVFMNDPSNQTMITKVAQRNASRWAAFREKKLTDGKYCSPTRYEAINVTDSTAEFRIFRGNLRPERILKNLEFCHAVCQFSKLASLSNLTWAAFWQYVTDAANRHQYRNLIAFIDPSAYTVAPNTVNTTIEEA